MKPALLALLLSLFIVGCKSSSNSGPSEPQINKNAEFEKLLEAKTGYDYVLAKSYTETPGYVVFWNKDRNSYAAYNIAKYDFATMKTYDEYLMTIDIQKDVIRDLAKDSKYVDDGYWDDVYETRYFSEEYYDSDCDCYYTDSWSEEVWVGETYVDTSYWYTWYTGSGFKFSNNESLPKDFETLKALSEEEAITSISNKLKSTLSLSTDRSAELGKIYYKWKKLESKRALTDSEKSILMTDALGVSLKQAETAYAEKFVGDDKAYEAMLVKAAEVNRTTPEQIGTFLNQMIEEE
jgi:hypothetical protein